MQFLARAGACCAGICAMHRCLPSLLHMGITDMFRRGSLVYNESTGASGGGLALKSPWSSSANLGTIAVPAPIPDGPVSMAQALSVPPVSRAVQLYSTTTAMFPLVAEAGTAPAWLDGTSGAVTPRHRAAFTVQDLMFTAGSVWVKDVLDPVTRLPLSCTRVPRHLWTLDEEGYVTNLEGMRLDQERIIYFPSLSQLGFLDVGAATVRHYHYLGKQILNRSRGGKPLLDLHIKDQYIPTDEEAEEAVDNWVNARLAENGAVTLSPWWLEVRELGSGEVSMLTEARNAVRLDVANFLNINAAMLDGNNGTSDTYSNTLQNTAELLQLSLRAYLTVIEQRLSQDDVTAPGVKIRFDTSEFDSMPDAKGNTGSAVAPATTAQEIDA